MPDMGRSSWDADDQAAVGGSAVVDRPASTGWGSSTGSDSPSWSDSGLGSLTGRADGPPLGPPPGLVPGVRALAASIAHHSARLGRTVDVDPLGLMAARARLGGLRRRGSVSCGGSSRLLRAADGWTAVSLARPSDWELAPAWLGLPGPVHAGDWSTVTAAVGEIGGEELIGRTSGLGLPVARVGERLARGSAPVGSAGGIDGITARRLGDRRPPSDPGELVVVDLSALWAGPLVGALLVRTGARVVKVESPTAPGRGPDGVTRALRHPRRRQGGGDRGPGDGGRPAGPPPDGRRV